LREQVSIRDLPTILEAVLDVAATNKNSVLLVETARQALGRALVRPLLSETGGLRVVTLDRALEDELGRAFGAPAAGSPGAMQPPFARRIADGLRKLAGEHVAVASPVLLCATPARYHLKRLLEPFLPKIVVLSPLEVPPVVEVQSLGVLR
jgi:flagellar biosynthesis protein FlhA